MRAIGFSTGALAHGDFRRALQMLEPHPCAIVELSALRDHELAELMTALPSLDLHRFGYVAVHAPSRFDRHTEAQVAEMLAPCLERGLPIILHPDAISDHGCWRQFGSLVCLENMDDRKPSGRTARELAPYFDALPEAGLCLDLGHARHVDPTLAVARAILAAYGDRLTQIHLSELNASAQHERLSMATVWSIREIARGIPDAPVILESVVSETELEQELTLAAACFGVAAR